VSCTIAPAVVRPGGIVYLPRVGRAISAQLSDQAAAPIARTVESAIAKPAIFQMVTGLPHRGGPPSMLESGGYGRPAGLTGA
jgi:hypothetical protein